MTNVFVESFDNVATADLILKLYTNITPFTVGAGRTNNGLVSTANGPGFYQSPINKILPASYGTLIFGTAFKTSNPAATRLQIISFGDGIVDQIAVVLTSAGQFQFWRGTDFRGQNGTLIGQSNHVYDFGGYYFFEFKIVFAGGSAGSINYCVNGVAQPAITGVTTMESGLPQCNIIRLWQQFGDSNTALPVYFDDMYANDTTGSKNNDYMGDVQIFVDRPTSAVSTTFTPNGAAPNVNCIKDITPDYDTTYISSATVGNVDLYNLSSPPVTTGLVKAVQTNIVARKDDALTRQLAPVLGDGVHTPNVGNTVSVGNNYVDYLQTYDQNPLTGADWLIGDFATLQLGVKEMA